jgi:phenylpropionate dioxygenase-like ring-hydroxylating dioxygenase large terminal subunit
MSATDLATIDSATLPALAGGPDPERFDCTEAWYPVFYIDDLDRARPNAFTLLDRPLVIWWDAQSQAWQAFADQCPHRLVPLSEGRISDDGLLECPYHGWAFGGSGECQRIPQQDASGCAHTAQRACVPRFATAVRQGLLFVYAGSPERAAQVPIPIVEPLEETPSEWVMLNIFRDLPYDAFTLLENVLDSSHLPFTHHKSVGNRANAAPMELEIVSSDKSGFRGHWAEGPRRGKLGSQDTVFIAPGLMFHDLTSKQFGRTLTVVYATPMRKGSCRLFARFPFKFPSKFPAMAIKLTPRWYSHLQQNAILEDDQIFLHLQERALEAQGGAENFTKAFYLPTKADRFVFEFRQWSTQFQADLFPGQRLPPAASRPQLLDRYQSHTQHCVSCRDALRRVQKIRLVCAGLMAIAWTGSPIWLVAVGQASLWSVGLAAIAPLTLAAVWWKLGQLERQFYQGRAVPPRNFLEKKRQGG